MSWSHESRVAGRERRRWRALSPVCLLTAGLATAAPGQTPVLTDQSLSDSRVLFIGVSAVSGQVAWLSGTRGTWARTLDGGATWQTGVVPGADSLQFRDVHTTGPDTAWVLSIGNGDQSRIYHTTDGGASWTLQFTNADPQAFFDCLAFWDGRRGLAVSDAVDGQFVMIRTDDGGARWSEVEGLPPAVDGEGMFAASGTCLVTHGTGHAWFGTGAGRTARVGRTTDGGHTWQVFTTPIVQDTPTAGITSLAFFDERRGLALGGDIGKPDAFTDNVAWTDDGGVTWTLVGRPTFTGAVYGSAIVPGRSNTAVAVGPKGAAWTADAGRTWQGLDSRNFWSVGFSPEGTGWMVGVGGRIVRLTIDD